MRCFIILVLLSATSIPQSISGTIYNAQDNSPLANCNITLEETSIGTVSNNSGKFLLKTELGSYTLLVSYVGFEPYSKKINLTKEQSEIILEIWMKPAAVQSDEVKITGNRGESTSISREIDARDIEKMPLLYNDVLRSLQVLPGVISISELSSGYNVRGGNFDENLIYLNGFEIYRPFLLRQGVEENQTLINPDLTNALRFYNGSFPALYGDKMSSALEVNYSSSEIDKFSGNIRADLLNSGLSLKQNFGDLKAAVAARYSYPGLFLKRLQTNGDYRPAFYDVQLLSNYNLNEKSSVDVFLLYAHNKFDLTPEDWIGQFGGFMRGDYRSIDIYYNGVRNYSFNTALAGIRYSTFLNDKTVLTIAASMFNTTEEELSNVGSESYYLPDARDNSYKEYLKSGSESVNNNLKLISYELNPQLQYKLGSHVLTSGINIKLSNVKNHINEEFIEIGDSVVGDLPFDRLISQKFSLNSYSAFVQDEFDIFQSMVINAGLRNTYYQYNKELMVSPRVNITWLAAPLHIFTFSWGHYYQPPYYAELRNKADISEDKLKSQRAIHYSAGWEYQFKEKLKLTVEAFYKDLFNLIPYYIDREKTEYSNRNSNKGFAYGFDAMVQGEIIQGLNSWLGYAYLNTQEKNSEAGEYHRRLTDNNHSIQVFLQDKIRKHPNWQAHLRLLFNTGYVFNLRRIETGEDGKQYIKVYDDQVRDYPSMYMRADMGLSASFDIEDYKLIVIAEVQNLFDHRNFGNYRFVQFSKEMTIPIGIPQVLSSRFFNIGVDVKF